MKFLFSIFLTATLLLNSFSNAILYVTFKINQNEIAKTLCVLREQKNNSCNGNCVLRAELKKQAESEQKHSTLVKEKIESIYTITPIECSFTPIAFKEINQVVYFHCNSKPNSVSFTVFHPPIA